MASLRWLGKGRWEVVVQLGVDEDGRYRRTSRRFDGAPPTERGNPPKAVRQEAARLEAELGQRKLGEPDSFGALCALWLEEWRHAVALGERSPTTAERYAGIVRRHVLPSRLARKRVRDVTVGDLDRWYVALRRAGQSASSVRQVHAVVSQALKMAARNGWVASNPALLARKPSVRAEERRRPTAAQVLAVLLAAHRAHPARARALRFAARTGLRRGEVAGVRWSRVGTEAGLLLVDTNVVVVGGELVAKEPKGRKALPIPIDAETVALVEEQQAWQLQECAEAGVRPAKDPWLWSVVAPFDAPLWPAHLTDWMEAARGEAGESWMRLHDLRHWHGSQLGDAVRAVPGASRADVQRMLRHAQPQTTDRYLHAEEDHAVRRRLLEHLPTLELPEGEGR